MYQKSWYDLQFLRYRVLKIKNQKIRILKHEKNCWRYNHFTHMYQSRQSYEVQFLSYEVRQTEFFVTLGHFLPFHSPNNPENQNFEKKNKLLEMSSFYTFVTKTMIIWCMLPEKWSATNKIFCHFGSLCGLSPPTNNPKYWKLEKCKKILKGDIFLLHMCAINKCYMMSGSWGIRHDRHSFLSFSAICCPFTPFFLFWTS